MYLEYGFDEYVSKPIEVERLETMMLRMLPEHMIVFEKDDADKETVTQPSAEKPELLKEENDTGEEQPASTDIQQLTEIDRRIGMSYVMDSEELYREILHAFCEQVEEYLPQLQLCYQEKNWPAYAVLAHALKGNARNIGATAFSEFSKKQEFAAKESNESVLLSDYDRYIELLVKLKEEAKKLLQ